MAKFQGYGELIRDTGHQSDFAAKYSMPVCLINIGLVGTCFLLYLDVIMVYTEGVGFTGATIGVVLAAMTFTCMGQHPGNIWPILADTSCSTSSPCFSATSTAVK